MYFIDDHKHVFEWNKLKIIKPKFCKKKFGKCISNLLPKHALKGKSFSPIYSIRLKLIDIQHLPKRKRKNIQLKKSKRFG
jgi:hypothetical protein